MRTQETYHAEGPCPFLLCNMTTPHDHPICPDCGAVRYGSLECPTCQRERAKYEAEGDFAVVVKGENV